MPMLPLAFTAEETLAEWWTYFVAFWPHLTAATALVLSVVASAHVVMYKRDNRAAIGWVGLIWLSPILGSVLYFLMGINRIRRKAHALKQGQPLAALRESLQPNLPVRPAHGVSPEEAHLVALANYIGRVTQRPLLGGNKITPLANADAYPQMLAAIDGAKESIALATYIFNNDSAGRKFAAALGAAVARGVTVRVLIDDIGARYSFPSIVGALRRAKVPTVRFLRSIIPIWSPYSNLRNHRKIMVVDGCLGFTGGMNIQAGHAPDPGPKGAILDTHFRLEGPVVGHLAEVFAEDWQFAAREPLEGPRWFPPLAEAGQAHARGIAAGPDEDFEKLNLTLLGALACARSSVYVVTPYFLPDASLITALNVADMRGVDVNVLLPEKGNLGMVAWASRAQWWQVLQRGCRLWLTPPPFDHSKLMLVDDVWTLFGSCNWDPRSLRLNFEFNVECYDRDLAAGVKRVIQDKLRLAREVSLEEIDRRRIPIRLWGGVARLLSPYL